jgi:signal peptidase I
LADQQMTSTTTPRRRFPAALLSLGLPGLGEVYAGRPKAAAVTFALFYVFSALSIAALFAPFSGIRAVIVPVSIVLAAWVVVVTRAVRAASHALEPYPLQPYNRWYWYLSGVIINLLIWQPAIVSVMRSNVVQAFRIPSRAMEPTLLVGDFIFASRRPSARSVSRNDIVIVESPGEGKLLVVKRAVGMPGDTLSMRDGALIRNGAPAGEPFTHNIDSTAASRQDVGDGRSWQLAHLVHGDHSRYHPDMRNWGPIIVPPDSVFLLGDNRDESFDSRFYGAVGMDRVRGKPLTIYFSVGAGSIRWGRFGQRF